MDLIFPSFSNEKHSSFLIVCRRNVSKKSNFVCGNGTNEISRDRKCIKQPRVVKMENRIRGQE